MRAKYTVSLGLELLVSMVRWGQRLGAEPYNRLETSHVADYQALPITVLRIAKVEILTMRCLVPIQYYL